MSPQKLFFVPSPSWQPCPGHLPGPDSISGWRGGLRQRGADVEFGVWVMSITEHLQSWGICPNGVQRKCKYKNSIPGWERVKVGVMPHSQAPQPVFSLYIWALWGPERDRSAGQWVPGTSQTPPALTKPTRVWGPASYHWLHFGAPAPIPSRNLMGPLLSGVLRQCSPDSFPSK